MTRLRLIRVVMSVNEKDVSIPEGYSLQAVTTDGGAVVLVLAPEE
jgi:hypothetical protein